MAGISSNLRVVNPFGLSTGGTHQAPLATSKPVLWLKSVFQRMAPKQMPKVVKSQVNGNEVLLRRTGRQAALDLRLLGRSPPKPPGSEASLGGAKGKPVAEPPQTGGSAPTLGSEPKSDTVAKPGLTVALAAPSLAAKPPAPTSLDLKAAATSLRETLSRGTQTVEALRRQHSELQGKQGATGSPEATANFVEAQRSAGAAVNSELDAVTKLIGAAQGDLSLAAEVAVLTSLRSDLSRQAILIQQPALALDIPRGNDIAGLRSEVQLIEMMIDDLASGQDTTELIHDLDLHFPQVLTGREVTLGDLRDLVRGFAKDLELSGTAADQQTAVHLRGMAAVLDVRLEVADAANNLASLKNDHPALDLSALTRQFRLALPPIDWRGNIGDPAKLRMAAGGVNAFAALVRDGDVPDVLIGTHSDLNAALLKVKIGKSQEQALAVAQSRSTVPLGAVEIEAAKESGKKIATLRHELILANRTLETHLQTDRRSWKEPSSWGEKGRVFGSGASSVRKDAQFMKALTKLGGQEAGRDVLVLIARISVLEAETVRLEKSELGLHPRFDLAALGGAVSSDPLVHLGLDNKDLARIGIKGEDRDRLVESLGTIVGKGVLNLDQVDQAVEQLNAARTKVLRNTLVQGAIGDVAGSTLQASAQALLRDLLVDVRLADGKPFDAADLRGLGVSTPEVDGFFKRMAGSLKAVIASDGTRDAMLLSADAFRKTELEIATLSARRQSRAGTMERLESAIGDAKANGLSKDEIAGLKATVKALRQDVLAIDTEIARHGTRLDTLSDDRAKALGPILREAQTMIRTAVLATLPAQKQELSFKDGRLDQQLQPMARRTEIETMLAGWGFDMDAFAPELDSVLYGTLGTADLANWRDETDFSSRFKALAASGPQAGLLSVDALLRRQDMDAEAKSALKSLVDGFGMDDKLSFKAGQRITLDSLNVPVEPTGLASLRAKLSGSFLDQLSLELGSDGFKLHVRSGGEVKGSLDAVVGKSFGVGLGKAKLEAGGGVELGGGKLSGWTLKIPNTAEGKVQLTALIMKMADNQPIEAADMLFVSDVAPSSEGNLKGGVGLKAKAQLEGRLKAIDVSGGVQAEAGTGIFLGKKWGQSSNHKASMLSGELEVTGTVTISASAYLKVQQAANLAQGELFKATGVQSSATDHFGVGSDGKPKYDVSSPQQQVDLIGVSTTVTSTYVNKWKHERDENGRFTKAEIVRQTSVQNRAIGAVALIATKGLKARLSSDDPKDDEIQKKFGSLTALMGTDDLLSVTYACGKDQLARANQLLDEADTLRKGGRDKEAAKLESHAEAIVSEPDNHVPTKVALIKVNTDKRDIGNLNMRFVKWEIVSDSKFEHPTATIAL